MELEGALETIGGAPMFGAGAGSCGNGCGCGCVVTGTIGGGVTTAGVPGDGCPGTTPKVRVVYARRLACVAASNVPSRRSDSFRGAVSAQVW